MTDTRSVDRAPRVAVPSLGRACVGELVGTYILAFFGCGSVMSAVITGAQVGLWQVAVVWGFGITPAIYATAAASGAHLNPAVTLSVALRRSATFPASRVVPYWGAQLAGAFLAAATLYACFSPFIRRFEAAHHLVRGQPGSQLSAMVFGEYGPNPAVFGTSAATLALLSPLAVMLIEALGTALLLFFIFALVDRHCVRYAKTQPKSGVRYLKIWPGCRGGSDRPAATYLGPLSVDRAAT